MLRLRISNSGPEAKPADAPALLGDFAVYIEQAAINQAYITPAASAIYSTLINTNPVIPGTAAQVVLARPSSAPPPGYRWAILAHFSGTARFQAAGEVPIDFETGLQLQFSDDNVLFVPLSTTLSGAARFLIEDLTPGEDVFESIDLHSTRVFAGDTWQGDEGVVVRVGWGCPTTDGTAAFITGDEGETGGWDLTAQWVITPINEVLPPTP